MTRTAVFDPRSATASSQHREVYGRYQRIYTVVEFAAALAFVVGSVLFFFPSQQTPGTWFFLVGSVLFAARPTVRVLRDYHLARIPLPGDATS
ncbi:YrhK family protein [Pseudonocardia sp. KRD-184]|uniref:YrhK family protein n=1 Tax=Pseudonocardia oceani TaxID=2792013 RepID=A0ABS6UI92_9PSEU|nr:YrhK family protein [Pseudonocardia oceani]MBW0090333.1 YrhK family protein [Pseudonocardia oceani]MBW0099217.1 YrhK family protein [Pseudonocardia oceani]MBW0111309.1 YrhK family protein [Pseudonocardia oceani]MBW0123355.1 YrhK family protein [Pseudonocardia oceani]MBW0131623.1 YrhK family protein [Pseudonocardia oceani]